MLIFIEHLCVSELGDDHCLSLDLFFRVVMYWGGGRMMHIYVRTLGQHWSR